MNTQALVNSLQVEASARADKGDWQAVALLLAAAQAIANQDAMIRMLTPKDMPPPADPVAEEAPPSGG